jgi:hypothetical protein
VCFGARFVSGEGLVPRDELATFPRAGLAVESKRMESTVYSSNPAGVDGTSHSKWIRRLALLSGEQRLHGDVADDGAGRKLAKALRRG